MTEPADPRARSYLSAGALFFDEEDRVMLLHTTYKEHWEIPGGFVLPGESPFDGCRREVLEELAVEPPIGPLLAVDYSPTPAEGDKVVFVFDGGRIGAQWLEAIRLGGDGEIDRWEFHPIEEAGPLLIPRLHRRIASAVRAHRSGRALYLEGGEPRSDEERRSFGLLQH
jgi:ADP-ribose pyrophosphatase YjhB (NUDIX family)